MKMNYQIEIDKAIDSGYFGSEDIYDYRNTPLEAIMNSFYGFCRTNLDINSNALKIEPNIFVFNNDFSVNAQAIRDENGYIISMNLGLFQFCYQEFLNNTKLNTFVEKIFPQTTKMLGNPVSYLAYQTATQFTFYHEKAHLIQFTKRNYNSKLQEKETEKGDYSKINHLLEINADTYASYFIALHLEQFIDKRFVDKISQKTVIETIQIFGCCLLYYFTTFYPSLKDVYFEKYSHPHPLLRLFNSILNISNTFSQSSFFKQKRISIHPVEPLKEVFDLYERMEQEHVFKSEFSKTLDIATTFGEKLESYWNELILFDLENYQNSLDTIK